MQLSRQARFVGALALTLAAGGCGGGGSPSSPPTTATPSLLSFTKSTGVGTLTATLAQDNARVARSSAVTYTLRLTNPSSASAAQSVVAKLDSSLTPTPLVTLTVLDPSGSVAVPTVPSASEPSIDPPSPPGVQTVTLQPGESLSLTSRRAVFGKRGIYKATATFTVASTTASTSRTVIVGPLPVTIY